VAAKVLKAGVFKGREANLGAEVAVLMDLRSGHTLQFIGACLEGPERFIVTECVDPLPCRLVLLFPFRFADSTSLAFSFQLLFCCDCFNLPFRERFMSGGDLATLCRRREFTAPSSSDVFPTVLAVRILTHVCR
jgi:hypothetical protein